MLEEDSFGIDQDVTRELVIGRFCRSVEGKWGPFELKLDVGGSTLGGDSSRVIIMGGANGTDGDTELGEACPLLSCVSSSSFNIAVLNFVRRALRLDGI